MTDSQNGATLLLVEDDENTLRIVTRSIVTAIPGVDVVVARDGKEGVKQARKRRPDIVILDWMMPDYDGEYFLTEQAKDTTISGLPVLLHTVVDENQTSDALSRFPSVKAFVKKLMPPEDLIGIIKSYLLLRSGGFPGS